MSTNVVGVKLQSSGWCGSNRSSSGGSTISNALATPAPAASARARSTAKNASAWSGLNGSLSVCVSSTSGLNSRITSAMRISASRSIVERVVAEVEGDEVGAEGRRGALRLPVADLLHALLGLARLLPELARLAALAVGERDDAGGPAARRWSTAIAPPARQTKSAEWAPITSIRRLIRPPASIPRRSSSGSRRRRSRRRAASRPRSRARARPAGSRGCRSRWRRSCSRARPRGRRRRRARSVVLPLSGVLRQRSIRQPRSTSATWSSIEKSWHVNSGCVTTTCSHAFLEGRLDDGERVVAAEVRGREHEAVPRDRPQHVAGPREHAVCASVTATGSIASPASRSSCWIRAQSGTCCARRRLDPAGSLRR